MAYANLDKLGRVLLAANGGVSPGNEEHDYCFVFERLDHVNGHCCFGTSLLDRRQLHEGAGGDCRTNGNHVETIGQFHFRHMQLLFLRRGAVIRRQQVTAFSSAVCVTACR